MNLRQLTYFARVVEVGNMTRAAQDLHIAQPALGMQIRQLEEDLGVALLVRHSRGVDVTAAGALLHRHALAIFGLVEAARREVVALAGDESEVIRLGLTPALMLMLGADMAMAARERMPHVFLSLAESMSHVLADALLRGEIDLALGYDFPDHPQLSRLPWLEEDLVFVALPDREAGAADAGAPMPFRDVVEEPLILPELGDSVRTRITEAANAIGVTPQVAFEVRSVPAMKSLILRGAAAGVLPYASVLAEVRERRLVARRVTAPALRRTLFLAARADKPPLRNDVAIRSLIRSCVDTLVEALGPLAHPIASA